MVIKLGSAIEGDGVRSSAFCVLGHDEIIGELGVTDEISARIGDWHGIDERDRMCVAFNKEMYT